MSKTNIKKLNTERRHKRVRAKISGTGEKPRLSVFKSNKAVFAQLIDDVKGATLVGISSLKMKGKTKTERAKMTGLEIGKIAIGKKVKQAVFDRGGFRYTGIIKAVAEGARESGLKF